MRTGDTLPELLRGLIDERGTTIRGLAREIAQGDKTDTLENWRRDLNRYLHDGVEITPDKAALMERRLSLPDGYFPRRQPKRVMRLSLEERLAALERAAAADAQDRAALRDTQEELVETVAGLKRSVAALQRRIAALERQPRRAARGSGGGAA